MSKFLRVSNLRRSYDNVDAVKNINFEVEKGEFVALLGPSGEKGYFVVYLELTINPTSFESASTLLGRVYPPLGRASFRR